MGLESAIGGGACNTTCGGASNIAGGNGNTVSGNFSNVAGGQYNTVSGYYSNVAGGQYNIVTRCNSNIGGGDNNSACTIGSFIGGGCNNRAHGIGTVGTIAGGFSNTLSSVASFSFIGGGCGNAICNAQSNVVGGANNVVIGSASSIIGGCSNVLPNGGSRSFIAGGCCNYSNSTNTFILGSNLSAAQANYTYANNLSVQGTIYAGGNIFGGTYLNILSGTTYTIQLSDNNTLIGSTNATTGLSAVPSNSITYPVGFEVGVLQLNSARISLSGAGTPAINHAYGYFKTNVRYSAATLVYTGTPGWVVFGDLGS